MEAEDDSSNINNPREKEEENESDEGSDLDQDTDNDENSDSDEDENSAEDEEMDSKLKHQKKKGNERDEKSNWKGHNAENERQSDVGEGKTLFIRNLDFSTPQDSLRNFMEQFGPVHYALLCMDKVMERPKGTGFVKFKVYLLIFQKDTDSN